MAASRPILMTMRPALVVAALLLTGCGTATGPEESSSGSSSGSLHLSREEATHPEAGAAGEHVECDTFGSGGFSEADVYAEGATAGTPEEALDVAASEWLFPGPRKGLERVAEEGDRVLFVLEIEGEVKEAIVVRDGPATEGAGGDGWYVESWAQCDPVELPPWYTGSIGLRVWTDEKGRPVPTSTMEAWRGPKHCEWQAMTFLQLRGTTYVGNLQPELEEFAVGPYRPHVELPGDAVDTGFRRHGDRLWLAADRTRAYVGADPNNVEEWPSAQLGCD